METRTIIKAARAAVRSSDGSSLRTGAVARPRLSALFPSFRSIFEGSKICSSEDEVSLECFGISILTSVQYLLLEESQSIRSHLMEHECSMKYEMNRDEQRQLGARDIFYDSRNYDDGQGVDGL